MSHRRRQGDQNNVDVGPTELSAADVIALRRQPGLGRSVTGRLDTLASDPDLLLPISCCDAFHPFLIAVLFAPTFRYGVL
jgi:hypothetical protein